MRTIELKWHDGARWHRVQGIFASTCSAVLQAIECGARCAAARVVGGAA
jgi:hypothetical protein